MIRVGDSVRFSTDYLRASGVVHLPPFYGTGWVKALERITPTLALATVEIDGPGPIKSFKASSRHLEVVS